MKSYILQREAEDPREPREDREPTFSLDYKGDLNAGQLAAACALRGPVLQPSRKGTTMKQQGSPKFYKHADEGVDHPGTSIEDYRQAKRSPCGGI